MSRYWNEWDDATTQEPPARARLLLVGEAFGTTGDWTDDDALAGLAGERIAGLAGITTPEYLWRTRRINLVRAEDDYADTVLVAAGVQRVRAFLGGFDRVVVLGARAATALGILSWPLYEWTPWLDTLAARAPHPSGRNRYWNEPENVERARAFWRDALDAGKGDQ
jgi:uracil-DNA glycosylase